MISKSIPLKKIIVYITYTFIIYTQKKIVKFKFLRYKIEYFDNIIYDKKVVDDKPITYHLPLTI